MNNTAMKRILSCTAAALMALSFSLPAMATSTTNSMEGTPPASGSNAPSNSMSHGKAANKVKEYPEMSAEDCRNLGSNRKQYKKSEYLSRKEYCNNLEKNTNADGPGANTKPGTGPATDQNKDNRLNDDPAGARDNTDGEPGSAPTGNTLPGTAPGTTGNTTP